MRLKFIQERASVLNTASAKSGVPFVVSAATAELPKVETAAFGCKACSAEFASTKGSEPFCVNCGSENVSPIQATAQALPETDTGLSAITCKSCGTHNVLSDVTASTLDGHMHCVECGNQLSYDVDELQDPVTDADESAIEQTLNTESADTNSAEDRGGMTNGDPLNDVSETDVADALPTTEATAVTDPATPAVTATAPEHNEIPAAPAAGAATPATPEVPVVEPIVDKIEDETLIEHASWEQLPENEQDGCEYSETSLAAVILAGNPKAVLTLATSENEILAFADGVPVARLEKANAGEHAAVFHTQSFLKSIARVAETSGARAALASYKFDAIKVKFPVSAAARAKAATALKEQTAALQETASSHREDLMQCVSIASAALTKNLFRTKANALKRGFVDMLTTAGVKNATQMVERVFAANADAYHKQVFELAQELQSKPLEYRNTLASSMGDLNTVALDFPNEENQEVVVEHASGSQLEHQMESAAVRGVRQPVTASTTDIRSIRAAAGGKLF